MRQHEYWVDAGKGIRLFAKTWGDKTATPIVLVHGYPDNHRVWALVAEALASSFYVIAYDVRGAGQSTIPPKIKDYSLNNLAKDLQAVVNTIIPKQNFHLVGHDWGSIQSWESVTTAALKGRILSYTTLSGPCIDHAAYWLRTRAIHDKAAFLNQMKKSWYIMLFQAPWLGYQAVKHVGNSLHKHLIIPQGGGLYENPTSKEDMLYGIRLYQANFISHILMPQKRYAHCPVQAIVLEQDAFVGPEQMEDLSLWVKTLTVHKLSAKHWAVLTHAKEIADLISNFAKSNNS